MEDSRKIEFCRLKFTVSDRGILVRRMLVESSDLEGKDILQSLLERIPGGVWFPLTLCETLFSLSITVGERVGEGEMSQAVGTAV